ncbi:unnamed protein product, partial [Phaeothamnion confervicola]
AAAGAAAAAAGAAAAAAAPSSKVSAGGRRAYRCGTSGTDSGCSTRGRICSTREDRQGSRCPAETLRGAHHRGRRWQHCGAAGVGFAAGELAPLPPAVRDAFRTFARLTVLADVTAAVRPRDCAFLHVSHAQALQKLARLGDGGSDGGAGRQHDAGGRGGVHRVAGAPQVWRATRKRVPAVRGGTVVVVIVTGRGGLRSTFDRWRVGRCVSEQP